MVITLIAAMAQNRVIGQDNSIPWDLPADRRRFRALTMGHPVIMGRKTFQSLPCSLDGRTVIVLTRDRGFDPSGVILAGTLDEGVALATELPGGDELFIAGGGELYRQALSIAHRILLTIVHHEFVGDVTFPELPHGQFVEISREELPGTPSATFICLERVTHP